MRCLRSIVTTDGCNGTSRRLRGVGIGRLLTRFGLGAHRPDKRLSGNPAVSNDRCESTNCGLALPSLHKLGRSFAVQQAICVLGGGALPGRAWGGEVDLELGRCFDARVVEHLIALVPGQRPAQARWERDEDRDQDVRDLGGRVAVGKVDQHGQTLSRPG